MKKLIFILLLLLSVGAMAQAMDTTLVVDAQGDTVGLVYKKGEHPVIPEEYDIILSPIDSVAYYEEQITKLMFSGVLNATVGAFLLPTGVAGAVALTVLLSGHNDAGYAIGVGVFVLPAYGLSALVAGLGYYWLKGGMQSFDKARAYEESLDAYVKKQSSVALQFVPVVDPVNKSLGGVLAMNF